MALSNDDKVVMFANNLPMFRTDLAVERGVERNLLMRTWGGIGDQICAEPTLRYALKTFKDCKISLASEAPELFSHLSFTNVFNLRKVQPIWHDYLVFDTIRNQSNEDLFTHFVSHMLTNCVDYPALCAFRSQLPVADREVRMAAAPWSTITENALIIHPRAVVVHPGKHWQSKTFPVEWWNDVLDTLIAEDVTPVLIGGDIDDNRGTVNVDTKYCLDLRGKLSLMESIALLKCSKVLLTNDSAPLHMAVDSEAWIGFVATCKHPDLITHWRRGQWGWRMQNHGKGGLWDVVDFCPNRSSELSAENVGDDRLRSWLPSPNDFAMWAVEKLRS